MVLYIVFDNNKHQILGVFPTDVGMNLKAIDDALKELSFPHGCGDEPCGKSSNAATLMFSPRMWG